MWIISVIVLFLGGMLAASELVLVKKPAAALLVAKVRPFQSLIGVLLLVWGVVDLINWIRFIGSVPFSIYVLLWLVTTVTELALGFLLSFELLSQYILRNEQAHEKAKAAHERVAGLRQPLGLAGMGLAILFLVLSLWYSA